MHTESSAWAADSAPSRVGPRRPLFLLALSCLALALALPARAERRCYSPATASRRLHRKLCVKARVYSLIKLDDGARILDVCSARTPPADCRFALVNLNRNRAAVGRLRQFVGKEVEVRGKILPVHGRAEILLTSAKQLRVVQPPHQTAQARVRQSRFHPNPTLLKGFNATQNRMPIANPSFRGGSKN